MLLDKGWLVGGYIVHRVHRRAGIFYASCVTDGIQFVLAFRDVFRFGKRHIIIHRRTVQQHIGDNPDERPGVLRAVFGIAFRQTPEENRREKHVILTDGTRQAPEHPCGLFLPFGINLVGHIHMMLADVACLAPQRQRALRHERVEILGVGTPSDLIKRFRIGNIDFMKFFRAPVPRCGHWLLPPYIFFSCCGSL